MLVCTLTGSQPTKADLSLVRLALRSSTKASSDYVLLDSQHGNRLLSSSSKSSSTKEAGSPSWLYTATGEHVQVPQGKVRAGLPANQEAAFLLPSLLSRTSAVFVLRS